MLVRRASVVTFLAFLVPTVFYFFTADNQKYGGILEWDIGKFYCSPPATVKPRYNECSRHPENSYILRINSLYALLLSIIFRCGDPKVCSLSLINSLQRVSTVLIIDHKMRAQNYIWLIQASGAMKKLLTFHELILEDKCKQWSQQLCSTLIPTRRSCFQTNRASIIWIAVQQSRK